ncbi:MAG: diaminopimelate epimerase [Bacteroidota bacterium]|nr:diaminopimelate epimerase [Bacteroidota bacterium]
MKRTFYKYEGTGNDFILFDDRENVFDHSDTKLIAHLCNRRFGIGADGLMLLRNKQGYDFEMVYFNSDGNPSSMCGNGGRCISRFAVDIGAVNKHEVTFLAIDGAHTAIIGPETVKLKMNDVKEIESGAGFFYLSTGSPHYVKFTTNVPAMDVVSEGKKIRNSERFIKEGTNVNFVAEDNGGIFVRTYERGVEDETLSCGTGVTASALAAALKGIASSAEKCAVHTRGGNLSVHFKRDGDQFTNVWLEGPATFVFKGEIEA